MSETGEETFGFYVGGCKVHNIGGDKNYCSGESYSLWVKNNWKCDLSGADRTNSSLKNKYF